MYVVLIVGRYKGIRSNLYLSRKKIDEIFFFLNAGCTSPCPKFLLKQQNTLFLLLLGSSADYCNLLRHFYFGKVLGWFDWTILLLQGYDLSSVSCSEMLWCRGVLSLFCVDHQQQGCQSYPAPLTLRAAAPCLAQGAGSALPGPIPAAGSWFRLQPQEQWPCSPACVSGFCRSSPALLPKRELMLLGKIKMSSSPPQSL